MAWAYWLSNIFGNVGYAVLLMDALDYFFPGVFTGGNNLWDAHLFPSCRHSGGKGTGNKALANAALAAHNGNDLLDVGEFVAGGVQILRLISGTAVGAAGRTIVCAIGHDDRTPF